MKRTYLLLIAAVALTACSSQKVSEQTAEFGEEDVSVTRLNRHNAEGRAQISKSSARAFARIEEARKALANKEFRRAKRLTQKAAWVLEAVQSELPAIQIKDHIAILTKKAAAEETDTMILVQDLVPIYGKLNLVSAYTPIGQITKAKADLDAAKSSLKGNDRKGAIVALKRVGSAAFLTEASIPILRVERDVDRALDLMAQNLYTRSAEPLDDALKSLELQTQAVISSE